MLLHIIKGALWANSHYISINTFVYHIYCITTENSNMEVKVIKPRVTTCNKRILDYFRLYNMLAVLLVEVGLELHQFLANFFSNYIMGFF